MRLGLLCGTLVTSLNFTQNSRTAQLSKWIPDYLYHSEQLICESGKEASAGAPRLPPYLVPRWQHPSTAIAGLKDVP